MPASNRIPKFITDRDWRIWFGLVVTFIWIGGGLWFVIGSVAADPDQSLTLGVIGNFLEGAFAPLAFLWLVLGLFLQQRELANNTEVLRLTAEQSEKQTLAIAATEMNARQETFFKIKENVSHQLGGITGMLYSCIRPRAGSAANEMTRERDGSNMFKHVAANGDCEDLRTAQFLSRWTSSKQDDLARSLIYGTDIRHPAYAATSCARSNVSVRPGCRTATSTTSSKIRSMQIRLRAVCISVRMRDVRPQPEEAGEGPPAC